jgi:hypothetical protein
VFDGTSANGIWALFVVDDSDQDSGVIAQGWGLRFETTGDPTPTRQESPSPVRPAH